jgi:hypothetical protein
LFIDEFQNLNVASRSHYKETIQLFCSLSNLLSLPVVKIGTHESLALLLPHFKDSRRAGDLIDLAPYVMTSDESPGYTGRDWKALFEAVTSYQVVSKKIPITQSLENKLFQLSCGIPYVLFKLWQKVQIDAILSGADAINLKSIDASYKRHFKLIHNALLAIRTNKSGKFKDLINVSKLLDGQQNSQALNHLQSMVNKDDFTGSAAEQLNQAINDIEFGNSLSDKDKTTLRHISKRLEKNAHVISSGQSIDQPQNEKI